MRVDGIGARTWLLATVAGWALLAWLLAVAGMGGQTGRLADDPSLLQPLPQIRPSPPDRLGPLSQYAEIGARPLFAEDRRPHPFSLQPEASDDESNAFDYVLTGVLISPQLHMAIVQPSQGGESVRIKLGEAAEELPAWRLVDLDPRRAVFEGAQGRKSLDLRVFDGSGGQPPTPLRRNAANQRDADARAATQPPRVNTPQGKPMSQPAPVAEPAQLEDADSTVEDAATDAASDADDSNPEDSAGATGASRGSDTRSQMEAIRKRIEARRAQLRQDAQQQARQNAGQSPVAPAEQP